MTGVGYLAHQRLNQSEAEFTDAVIAEAQSAGWLVTHFRHAWTEKGYRTPVQGDAGFPDLVLVRERVIFAELKSKTGRVSKDQHQWLDTLLGVVEASTMPPPLAVYIWRPSQWDEIVELLHGCS